MSVKPQTKPEVKVPHSQMMVTRHKSAQQKRKLRDNLDRSMTKLTQLLKSPTSCKATQKKPSPKASKSPKKNESQSTSTINRVKRNDRTKKTWLKPKHELKMVAKANKRKLCTPLRGLKSPPCKSPKKSDPVRSHSPEYKELSVAEVIRIMDQTDALDDEDFIEILTCPSPVWWEDPPDPRYDEKPIMRRVEVFDSKQTGKKIMNHKQDRQTSETNKINFTHTKGTTHAARTICDMTASSEKPAETKNKCDNKFMTKRTKLESILGNIKKKINKQVENSIDSTSNVQENETNNVSEASRNDATIEREYDDDQTKKPEKSTCEDDSNSDLSINDDSMLKNLETMDIPIGDSDKNSQSGDDCKTDDSDSQDVEKNILATFIEKSPKEQNYDQIVPKNLPPLQRFPKIVNVSSPVSTKSDVDSCSTGNDNLDTISDTNVKFLDEASSSTIEENKSEELSETSLIILDKIKKFFQKDRAKQKVSNEDNNKKEFITVYKIVSEEPTNSNAVEKPETAINDRDITDHSKINSFYKKRKNAKRKVEDSDKDLNKKSLLLPNSENIKYCFKCSSIFETENCLYCSKKDVDATRKECVCDKSQCDDDLNNSCVSKKTAT